MRTFILVSLLFAATLPGTALARDCEHSRDTDLALDLAGIETVVFDIGPYDLDLKAAPGATASASGRACASSDDKLERLVITQRRVGATLWVRAGGQDESSWNFDFFGNQYASLMISAILPDTMPVRLDVGSGDAVVHGVHSLAADIGSGDLRATGIPGTVALSIGSGDAHIENVGALRIDSIGSGDATAARVRGATRVGSIGSGDFDLYGAQGDVEIGSIGSGDAGLRNITGDVRIDSLGSGDVDATDVSGDLVVLGRGSGDIQHRGVGGRVDLPADD